MKPSIRLINTFIWSFFWAFITTPVNWKREYMDMYFSSLSITFGNLFKDQKQKKQFYSSTIFVKRSSIIQLNQSLVKFQWFKDYFLLTFLGNPLVLNIWRNMLFIIYRLVIWTYWVDIQYSWMILINSLQSLDSILNDGGSCQEVRLGHDNGSTCICIK